MSNTRPAQGILNHWPLDAADEILFDIIATKFNLLVNIFRDDGGQTARIEAHRMPTAGK